MKLTHQNSGKLHLAARVGTIALVLSSHSMADPITGDTVTGNLTVTGTEGNGNVTALGWGWFKQGVDFGTGGEALLNWSPTTTPDGTAIFDIRGAEGAYLWRDKMDTGATSKMHLDTTNSLTLFKSNGTTPGITLAPEGGNITLPTAGGNIRVGTISALSLGSSGAVSFPVSPSFPSGLQVSGGAFNVTATTPSTSSTTGALTIAGGLGVNMDSHFNGVRIGKGAGGASTNTALGSSALNANTTGYANSALGSGALVFNTTGYYNSAVGNYALYTNTTGYYNSAFGSYALFSNTNGTANTATGSRTLYTNTTGASNSAFGAQALYSNTTGSSNSALGYHALYTNTSGSSNTAMGIDSLRANTTGSHNSAVGRYALTSNTTGGFNAAIGMWSLNNNTTGTNNVGMGGSSLYGNTTGNSNTGLGFFAGGGNSTGSFNIFLGTGAGSLRADGLGVNDLQNSIYIGANCRALDNDDDNSIVIGTNSVGEGANTTVIGNSSTTKTHLYGETNANSLKVAGATVLEGQVIIAVPQGDISMGNYP